MLDHSVRYHDQSNRCGREIFCPSGKIGNINPKRIIQPLFPKIHFFEDRGITGMRRLRSRSLPALAERIIEMRLPLCISDLDKIY